uniref:Uncharacterized protein n=1 Tax=Nelumbo nucifera TaxID=4432 RepID=A0A822YWS0_NELNU|nr:TPA_asm: hypothetical protein HUJ06_007628 [Nelumbo nucifera]
MDSSPSTLTTCLGELLVCCAKIPNSLGGLAQVEVAQP